AQEERAPGGREGGGGRPAAADLPPRPFVGDGCSGMLHDPAGGRTRGTASGAARPPGRGHSVQEKSPNPQTSASQRLAQPEKDSARFPADGDGGKGGGGARTAAPPYLTPGGVPGAALPLLAIVSRRPTPCRDPTRQPVAQLANAPPFRTPPVFGRSFGTAETAVRVTASPACR